jgi:hypothetical protein
VADLVRQNASGLASSDATDTMSPARNRLSPSANLNSVPSIDARHRTIAETPQSAAARRVVVSYVP